MAKKPTGTAVANWDEELAAAANVSSGLTDSGGGGKFFSIRAGQLSFDDSPLPGNQMMVVIGSWCLENVYYEEAYDPDNKTPPTCFAFCKDPDEKEEFGPPEDVDKEPDFDRQSDDCHSCPQNQWGSAAKGKGKACQNRRRLALLAAGAYRPAGKGQFELEMYEDEDHFAKAEVGYLKIPVMSGKGFDAYVRSLQESVARPTWAVYTRIWVEPDPKSQFKVCFEMEDRVPNELLPTLKKRHQELYKEIDFPYLPLSEEQKAEAAKPAAKANKKLAGKGKR